MAGETTSTTQKHAPVDLPAGLFLVPLSATYATGQLELNDVMELGYLPDNVTIYGFLVKATDMDTNVSPALVQKITVGSTDLVTGITAGQSGGNALYACTPTTITSKTKLTVTNTTAAATAAAGTLYVTAIVQK
jgi:hypothetical protein